MKDGDARQKVIRSRGLQFPYDPDVINRRRRLLLRDGNYERRESEAVLRHVDPEDRVIELGAGMGYMSTLLAAKVGVRGVHAYEANPRLIPYIQAVHEANGVENVTVTNAVLGPRKGKTDFFVRGDFSASSLQDDQGDRFGGVVAVEKVDVLNAKSVFRDIKPTALVCDIEGAEASVLPLVDLSCLRIAVVELHPQWIGSAGVRAVFDAMHAGGLTYFPRGSDKKVVTFRKDW